MVERVTVSESEALSMRGELDLMRQQSARDWRGGVRVNEPTNGSVTFQGTGAPQYQAPSITRVSVAIPNPKTVIVEGREVSRQAAELMGWIPDNERPFAMDAAHNQAQHGVDGNAPAANQELPKSPEDATWQRTQDEINTTLNNLYDTRGKEAADALDEAALTGDFDAATQRGFSQADVSTLVAGFTAYANREMKDLGVSVAMLGEVLNDAQLAEARKAALYQDASKLRSIAEGTKSLLADMPERDPVRFSAFFNKHFADIGRDIAPDGTFLVKVEGRGMTPWASAVRLGIVNIK